MSGTSGVVAFDYTAWSTRYPELSSIAQPLAQAYFNEATLYLDNTAQSLVRDASVGGQRSLILNMLTAHVAALNAPLLPGPNGSMSSSPLVGRIASAGEGSVSVSADLPDIPGTAAWFVQTKYGIAAWQALAPYRTFQYRPGRSRYGCGFAGWR